MSNDLIEEIELNIREAKKIVEMGDALERLTNNKDFKAVILEGYFKDQAVQLVQAKAAPSLQKPEQQAAINRSIDAIGELYQYFHKVGAQAEMAKSAISANEEALEDIVAEGDEV